ncbi:MAG: trigger factor [Mycoplasmataceae bacterium]|nr:trigger factor [Mycoplasmataceae bacterium]
MAKRELNKKNAELSITVSATKEAWKAEQEKAFNALAKNLIIKGFRKGSVPAAIAKKEISTEDIFAKAMKKQLDELVKVAAKEIKGGETILDSPTYQVNKISDTDLEVTFVYPLYPDITLPDYAKMGIQLSPAKIGDKVVDEEITKLLGQHALLIDKKGPVAKEDTVFFDFEGFVDGKQFEGGKADNYELVIGSGQFIEGFEDQMIGLKKGDKKDVKVSFPKEYQVPELAGKPATFKVLVNEIKSKETPKLTDEFVKEAGIPKAKTVVELKKYIAEIFTEQEEQNARGAFQQKIFAKIRTAGEIPLPSALVYKEMQNVAKSFMEDIKKQNISLDQYLQMSGMDQAKLEKQFKTQAELRLTDSLIYAEIAKAQKIELTDKDYDAELIKLAKVYGQTVEALKGMITREQMQIPMTNDKVLDYLIKVNKK